MVSQAILIALQVIEAILPLLTGVGVNSQTQQTISKIIDALTQALPLIVNEISTVYTAVKNIIASLQATGALTADQLAATQSLDEQVDNAWNAVVNQIDPDATPAP